jgi:hypothetical protein
MNAWNVLKMTQYFSNTSTLQYICHNSIHVMAATILIKSKTLVMTCMVRYLKICHRGMIMWLSDISIIYPSIIWSNSYIVVLVQSIYSLTWNKLQHKVFCWNSFQINILNNQNKVSQSIPVRIFFSSLYSRFWSIWGDIWYMDPFIPSGL